MNSDEIHRRWLLNALNGVEAVRRLPQNWDGYDAEPPSKFACQRADNLLKRIAARFRHTSARLPAPTATACPDGSLQLEWDVSGNTLVFVFPANKREPAGYFMTLKTADSSQDEADDLASEERGIEVFRRFFLLATAVRA